jgi:hypothetical protein
MQNALGGWDRIPDIGSFEIVQGDDDAEEGS